LIGALLQYRSPRDPQLVYGVCVMVPCFSERNSIFKHFFPVGEGFVAQGLYRGIDMYRVSVSKLFCLLLTLAEWNGNITFVNSSDRI
jgi:hypothetical protein